VAAGRCHNVPDIRALPPNHLYDIDRRQIVGYWPRIDRRRSTFEDFFSSIDTYFCGFAQSLLSKGVLLSITGGVDSRLLLAAFRHCDIPFRTLTFTGSNFEDWETEPIEKIVQHIRSEHQWIDERSESINEAAVIGNRNSGGFRGNSRTVAAAHEGRIRFLKGRERSLSQARRHARAAGTSRPRCPGLSGGEGRGGACR
jgi:hypothetical protein